MGPGNKATGPPSPWFTHEDIRHAVDAMPPLTEMQRADLAALFCRAAVPETVPEGRAEVRPPACLHASRGEGPVPGGLHQARRVVPAPGAGPGA